MLLLSFSGSFGGFRLPLSAALTGQGYKQPVFPR